MRIAEVFHAADVEKRRILALYRDDIRRAANRYDSRVSGLFENIPGFLSKHEKRVMLSEIDSNGSYDGNAIWEILDFLSALPSVRMRYHRRCYTRASWMISCP